MPVSLCLISSNDLPEMARETHWSETHWTPTGKNKMEEKASVNSPLR